MSDLATLGLAVDSKPIAAANQNLKTFTQHARDAERAAKGYEGGAQRATTATGKLAEKVGMAHGVLLRLGTAIGIVGASLGLSSLIAYADAWSDITARVNIAAGSHEQGVAVMERLSEMARRTYSSLTMTAESYLLNANALRELGYSTQTQLDFTEALNNALVVSGARGDRARSVTEAMSRAMALGQLRGEELNIVIQTGGRVAKALADGLGVTTNELRKMGAAGKLTSSGVLTALVSQLEQLREEADSMPATIGDAFVLLGNAVLGFVGRMDTATGASAMLSAAIITLADNVEVIAKLAAVAGSALLVAFAPTLLSAMAFSFGYLGAAGVAAMNAIKGAVASNPLGFFVVALTTAVTLAFAFRDTVKNVIGVDVAGIFQATGNYIIGSFVAAYEDIKFVWSNLPNILGAITIGTANAVIAGVEKMVNGATGIINALIDNVNAVGSKVGITIGNIGEAQFNRIENPYADALDGALAERNAAINKALSTNYLGALGEFIGLTGEATAATISNTDATKAATEALSKQQEKVRDLIKDLEFEISLFGKSAMQQEVEKNLRKAGAAATDEQRTAITRLTETLYVMREAYSLATDVGKGFVKDFVKGLKDGEGVWQSFANAGLNALNKISDKLLDMALDQAINGLFSSLFGGGIPGITGGGAGATNWMWAKGGAFDRGNVIPFARGGVVTRPTLFPMARGMGLMGEAGPEAIMPLKRGANGRLGVEGGGGTVINATFAPSYNVTGNGPEIEKLRADMARDRAGFKSQVVEAVREAQSRRAL